MSIKTSGESRTFADHKHRLTMPNCRTAHLLYRLPAGRHQKVDGELESWTGTYLSHTGQLHDTCYLFTFSTGLEHMQHATERLSAVTGCSAVATPMPSHSHRLARLAAKTPGSQSWPVRHRHLRQTLGQCLRRVDDRASRTSPNGG